MFYQKCTPFLYEINLVPSSLKNEWGWTFQTLSIDLNHKPNTANVILACHPLVQIVLFQKQMCTIPKAFTAILLCGIS